jgi:Domain of unknown function (DUF4382)
MMSPLVFPCATASKKCLNKYLVFASLLATSLSGCGNSCFVFVSNPGGGSFPPGIPSCSVQPAKTNIRVRLGSSPLPEQNDDRTRIEHIFLTVQGIEANSSTDENVPNWQELAPNLIKNPVQLDLLGRGDACASSSLDSAAVPSDVYRQVRLELIPDQADRSEARPGINACGRAGLNCLVTSDGEVRRVSIGNAETHIQVTAEQIENGFFQALPETPLTLDIEFRPQSSIFIPSGDHVTFIPAFTVSSQKSCEGDPQPNQ